MPTVYKKGYSDVKATEYIQQHYDQFSLRMPKGDRERYKVLAEEKGKSLNQLIIDLLDHEYQIELASNPAERLKAYAMKLNSLEKENETNDR